MDQNKHEEILLDILQRITRVEEQCKALPAVQEEISAIKAELEKLRTKVAGISALVAAAVLGAKTALSKIFWG
jgi:hypothetical protein